LIVGKQWELFDDNELSKEGSNKIQKTKETEEGRKIICHLSSRLCLLDLHLEN